MTTTTTDDPRQTLADLEARIVAGDTTVSATTLQRARAAAEFADLAAEGARRRAEAEAAVERQAAEDEVRGDIADAASRLASLQTAYDRLVGALRSFADETETWDRRRRELTARARALGIGDEAEVLVDLSRRDWVKTAADEAAGRYGSTAKPITVNGLSASRRATHELHSPQARDRIEAEQVNQLERSAAMVREQEAQKAAEREALEAYQLAQAQRDEAAHDAMLARAKVRR